MKLRLAGISYESLVDGPGLRTVIWGQGCPHACPGCHNAHTQEANGGEIVGIEEIFRGIDTSFLAQGITLSGGEPFLQPAAFAEIAAYARGKRMDVWAYTGYTFERLLQLATEQPDVIKLLKSVDILVDGPFVQAEKNLNLVFRGSGNQRIIDVPMSLEKNEPIVIPDMYFRNQKVVASF